MPAVRQSEGDGALGNLESFRRGTPGMKGNDGDSSEQAKNLDIDEHRFSLARGRGDDQPRLRSGRWDLLPLLNGQVVRVDRRLGANSDFRRRHPGLVEAAAEAERLNAGPDIVHEILVGD